MLQVERYIKNTVLIVLLRKPKTDRKLYIKKYQKDYYKRNKRINLTVNEIDWETICELSDNENKLPSAFVKEIVICRLKNEYYLQEDIKTRFSEFVRSIRGIANNINQIAHNTNITA